MARINTLENFLTDVATSIRTKRETQSTITPANYDTEILAIQTGTDTTDANAVDSDILLNKTAYVNAVKLTGTMPNNGALTYTPTTSLQSIPAGYTSGGTIASLEESQEYLDCLAITNEILGASY